MSRIIALSLIVLCASGLCAQAATPKPPTPPAGGAAAAAQPISGFGSKIYATVNGQPVEGNLSFGADMKVTGGFSNLGLGNCPYTSTKDTFTATETTAQGKAVWNGKYTKGKGGNTLDGTVTITPTDPKLKAVTISFTSTKPTPPKPKP